MGQFTALEKYLAAKRSLKPTATHSARTETEQRQHPTCVTTGIGGDAQYTGQEYRMLFHAVGYAGYGPARNTTEPKRYYFQYAADRRTLELLAR